MMSLSFLILAACEASAPPPATRAPTLIVVTPASTPGVTSATPAAYAPAPSPMAAASADRTDAELVDEYTPIWRMLLAQRNGASLDEVARAVPSPTRTIQRSGGITIMAVSYVFALDWAEVHVRDTILVRAETTSPIAPVLGPRIGQWLTASDIANLDPKLGVFGMIKLARLPFGRHNQYATRAAAVAALPGNTGVKFDESRARIFPPDPTAAEPNLWLEAVGSIRGTNHCLYAHLDLVTGAVDRSKGYCGPMYAR